MRSLRFWQILMWETSCNQGIHHLVDLRKTGATVNDDSISLIPLERLQTKLSFVASFQKFTGYRTNGMLLRVSGCLQSLYPTDGGLINVETVDYVEGVDLS